MSIIKGRIKLLFICTFVLIAFTAGKRAYADTYKIGMRPLDGDKSIIVFECTDDGTICNSTAFLNDGTSPEKSTIINIDTTLSKHEAEFVFRMGDELLFSQQNKPSYTTLIYPDSAALKTETIDLYIPHPETKNTAAEKSVFRKPRRHVATLNVLIEKK
ncbi:hypothetical protein [Micavibrio aeruginosavorus]|uniref:hypothetical protein n=1 Tax=Micavibrio aeruginosavorus TaxID=349221 RepID=UPI0005A12916|nr:hypothetical protein [Micavibrio aeruginosavorus]